MDWAAKRQAMVERQLRRRGIFDQRVLEAMAGIPRELFIPLELRICAYDDGPVSISGTLIGKKDRERVGL